MGKLRESKAMGLSMQLQDCTMMRYHYTKMKLPIVVWWKNGGVVVVDNESVAKMSSSDVDVEPYLKS